MSDRQRPPPALEAAFQMHQAGRLGEAKRLYEGFLAKHPDDPEALHLLGMIYAQMRDTAAALGLMRRAAGLAPHNGSLALNLVSLLRACGLNQEAAGWVEAVLRREPENGAAHLALAEVLQALDRHAEAVAHYEAALAHGTDAPTALTGLGMTLRALGREEEAEARYRAAHELAPARVGSIVNLALLVLSQGRHAEAQALLERALALAPEEAKTWFQFGNAMLAQHRIDDAKKTFRKAISLAPEDPEAHTHLGLAALLAGDLLEGFREYEWRLRMPKLSIEPLPGPAWNGAALNGAAILVHAEQGHGDILQYVRYAPLVAARGGRVFLRCPADLGRLLRRAPGIAGVITDRALPSGMDVHVHLMSLPHVLGTSLASIPADVPYLAPDAALVRSWRERLGGDSRLKVGVAWRGNPAHPNDRNRSATPDIFRPLLARPNARFFSLQKNPPASDLPLPEDIEDVAEAFTDFDETAACLANLDLVISVDTGIVHLAGALGRPVWVMLPASADWRWMMDRCDSPWYPTMRLFRQSTWRNWHGVMERIAPSLDALLAEHAISGAKHA